LSAFSSVVAGFPATSPAVPCPVSAKGTDAEESSAFLAEFSRDNGSCPGLLEVSFSASSSRNSLEYSSGPIDFLKASKYRYLVLDLILAPLTARSSRVAFMADHSFVVVMVNCLGTIVTITASPGIFVVWTARCSLVSPLFALVSPFFPLGSALLPSACAFFKIWSQQ